MRHAITSTSDIPLRHRFAFPLFAAALVFGTGCMKTGPDRVGVTGEVSLDGYPLASGLITFVPTGAGTAASGTITDGKFAIEQQVGPSPGQCRVEIMSYKPTGKKIPGVGDGTGMSEESRQIIPAQYNSRTTLQQPLTASGDNKCKFELKSL